MNVRFPVRAAFYYPWFPETWPAGHVYNPILGEYDTADVIANHTQELVQARVKVGIASWWGPGTHREAQLIPALLAAAAQTPALKWTVYYEKGEAGHDEIVRDLRVLEDYTMEPRWAYVRGKPVIFVYDTSGGCEVARRWHNAAPDWYVVLKVFDGWKDCPDQPDSWHQYGPSTSYQEHLPYSSAVSPGFWKFGEQGARLIRDTDRFAADVDRQVASRANWQLLTTFNEWGEGTAIEPSTVWGTSYLQILNQRRLS